MTMTCTICRHPQRVAIEQAIPLRSLRNIAQQFDVDYCAVNRHKHNHLQARVQKAAERRTDLTADALVERLVRLADQTDNLLCEAIADNDRRSAGFFLDAVRRNVLILARVVGAAWLDQPVNVQDNRVQIALTGLSTDEIRSLVHNLAGGANDRVERPCAATGSAIEPRAAAATADLPSGRFSEGEDGVA